MAQSLTYSEHKYGQVHELQTLGIWDFVSEPEAPKNTSVKYWMIFVHGGAWRDPMVDLHSVEPTITKLLTDYKALTTASIAGFASINYRLSPHPKFPQNADTTPPSQLRNASHPEHVQDLVAALELLHSLRPLHHYLLFGHSCGAFMAYQLLLGPPVGVPERLSFPLPTAVVGFEGIYDLNGLNRRRDGTYASFMAAAFGPNQATWDALSPALSRAYATAWPSPPRRLAVVAHSPEDELVDMQEAVAMDSALRESGVPTLLFTDLTGRHDGVRIEAVHTARVLAKTIEALQAE